MKMFRWLLIFTVYSFILYESKFNGNISILIEILIQFLINSLLANAIRCWRCPSDASNAGFCKDPFDASVVSEQQRRWSFVECDYPPTTSIIPVCEKTIQLSKNSARKKLLKNLILLHIFLLPRFSQRTRNCHSIMFLAKCR